MNSQDFEKAMLDVSKAFAAPEEIERRGDLTREQKVKLLQQWEYDLELLLVASEENMPSSDAKSDPAGGTGDLMQHVREALSRIGAKADPDKSGPTKSGGVAMAGERSAHTGGGSAKR